MTNAPKLPLWVIALGTGSAVMGITLITPALPAIVSALNALPEKVQQLLTFYLAMLALGQLAIGPLSDVFGRRIFFITGAFLIGASGLVASFISQIDVLIFLRAIQGLGAAACVSMGRTMVSDFFSRGRCPKSDGKRSDHSGHCADDKPVLRRRDCILCRLGRHNDINITCRHCIISMLINFAARNKCQQTARVESVCYFDGL